MKQNQKYHSCVRESLVMESGRSMVEMLGVLAIIGVLSVGGIAGYTTAINKHKTNEILNGASVRAIMAATQIGRGVPLNQVSLAEFGTDSVKGVSFDSTLVSVGASTDKFGIKASNVEKSICQNLVSIVGSNVKVAKFSAPDQMISASDCEENNVLAFIYNDDLRSFDSGSSGSTGATGATGESCSEGDRKCSGNDVIGCCGGSWQGWIASCPRGCYCGACIEARCSDGERKCSGDVAITCSGGDWWGETEHCPNGCSCGYCITGASGECTPGESYCCGNEARFCQDCGAWYAQECPNGCECGYCVSGSGSGESCSDGDRRCSVCGAQYCSGGNWYDAEYCPGNCECGYCMTGSTGSTGSSGECTPGEAYCCGYTESRFCNDCGYWESGYCPNGCECGYCVSRSGSGESCSDGERKCSGDYSWRCSGATWAIDEYCSTGCDAGMGYCKQCYPGEAYCCGDGRRVCLDSGFWGGVETCSSGICSSGMCVECHDGAVRCNESGNVETCSMGYWVETKFCSDGCSGGTCVNSSGS